MAKPKKRIKAKRKVVAGNSKYKMKTKRAAAKRYKVTGSGKVKVPHTNRRHNTGPKRRSVKNRLRRPAILRAESMRLVIRCLPNSF